MWRKTADALRETAVSDAGTQSDGRGVNKNGAPLLGDTRDLFRPKTSDIPAQPGVYKWRDGEGRVIYVGKAKNLRNRLTNYFQPLYQLHPRTQTMVLTARSLEWTVVATELESLTLEYTWIKEFDPRFNVVFRDDKTYPYLAISSGERIRAYGSRGQPQTSRYQIFRPVRQGMGIAAQSRRVAEDVSRTHMHEERVPQGAVDGPSMPVRFDRQMLRSMREPYRR